MYNGHTFGCILHKPRATQLLILSKHDLDGTDESVEVILYKAVCRGPWCGGNGPRPKSCRIQTCSDIMRHPSILPLCQCF